MKKIKEKITKNREDIIKGFYKNNPPNKKLHRVGKEYGVDKQDDLEKILNEGIKIGDKGIVDLSGSKFRFLNPIDLKGMHSVEEFLRTHLDYTKYVVYQGKWSQEDNKATMYKYDTHDKTLKRLDTQHYISVNNRLSMKPRRIDLNKRLIREKMEEYNIAQEIQKLMVENKAINHINHGNGKVTIELCDGTKMNYLIDKRGEFHLMD